MKGLKRVVLKLLPRKQLSALFLLISAGCLFLGLSGCYQKPEQKIIPYEPEAWVPAVWKSEPPPGCPFEPSREIKGLAFTGRYANYTDADTWYPSWADDGNMYSGWTDGEIGKESCHSSGGNQALFRKC